MSDTNTDKRLYTDVDGVEVYESEIHQALAEYIETEKQEDESFNMRKATQSTWNAALRYIYKSVFKGNNKLKNDNIYNINTTNRNHNNSYVLSSNCNSYNLDTVSYICNIYIDLCYNYNKECSIIGFSNMTGIDSETIIGWGSSNSSTYSTYQSSDLSKDLYKKIVATREETLSNKLVSSGQALGVLGVLNHAYGWNMGQPRETVHRVEVMDRGQIAARYGVAELSDNTKQLNKDK